MIKKILWILFWIVVVAAIGLGLFWLGIQRHWPWWIAVALTAGIVGLVLGLLVLKRHLLMRRERRFVQRVISADQAAIAAAPAAERRHLNDLQQHWMESVQRLQDSTLRARGNPLYALPWYLMIGESGMGKTSALANARVSSTMTEISRVAGMAGTPNCDWWFFDRAIVLDTAGRYTIPIDETTDVEEWKEFLALLARYRKKEPVNGVIVAVAADRLLADDANKLRDDGQSIRRRIDQTMRVTGAKFPVYLLITKMDLVHGFVEFCQLLPEQTRAQSMGYTNTELRLYWRDVFDRAMAVMTQRLDLLRRMILARVAQPRPEAVIFPKAFQGLTSGLETFLNAVFEDNRYQETPLFRGLFFSSALRKGQPVAEVWQTLAVQSLADPANDPESACFLKDFYQAILPRDRNLYVPLREFFRWRRFTQSIGIVSWLLIWIAACALLTFSFVHNQSALTGFSRIHQSPERLDSDLSTQLLVMDQMRREILAMQETNRGWVLPRFGLDHSLTVADRLRQHYLDLFQNSFLIPLDERLFKDIDAINEHSSEDQFVRVVAYVVTRIAVIADSLAGKNSGAMDEFKRNAADLLTTEDHHVQPEIAAKFGDIYQAYLNWSDNRHLLAERLSALREALVLLMEKKGRTLHWLTRTWIANARLLHLNDFWGAAQIGDFQNQVVLSGAFTEEGRAHIKAFIARVDEALGNAPIRAVFDRSTTEFWTWYRMQFYQAWHDFAVQFHDGLGRLETAAGWKRMAALMTTDQNPYLNLLQRMAREVTALGLQPADPPWAASVVHFDQIRELALKNKAARQGSLAGKLAQKKEEVAAKAFETIDARKAQEIQMRESQADAWQQYLDSLGKIDISVASRKQATDMYAACFDGAATAPGAGPSPLVAAFGDYHQLRGLTGQAKDQAVVWDLIFGPLDYLMVYAANETACFLQDQWQETVIGPISGADPEKISRMLFDKTEGLIWKYLNGPAKAFVGRGETGYFARRDLRNQALPLRGDFIHFLNSGSLGYVNVEPRYTLVLETLPMDVNDGAQVEPYACILTIACADGARVLKNFNYPSQLSITWSPESCSDVSLAISLPRLTLTRSYSGKMGMALFLKDFESGSRTFQAAEFEQNQADLKQMGIQWLRVAYKIKGAEPILRLLERLPTEAPPTIVTCWRHMTATTPQ